MARVLAIAVGLLLTACASGKAAVTNTPTGSPSPSAAADSPPKVSPTYFQSTRPRRNPEEGPSATATIGDRNAVTSLTEDLAFSGNLTGTIKEASSPHADSQSDPGSEGGFHRPTWTRCAFFKVEFPIASGHYDDYFEADIVGSVDQGSIALVIDLDTSISPIPGSFAVTGIGDTSIWLYGPDKQWYSTKGMPQSALTVNADLHSGTIAAAIIDRPYGGEEHAVHINGRWWCR